MPSRPIFFTLKTSRSRRAWWLLLALALFFSGQTLAASHWHDDGSAHGKLLDSECALCVYAATATAAIGSVGWQFVIPLFAVLWCIERASVRRIAVRFYDSQAPPAFSL